MPRFATVIKFTSADGLTVVDFSGCRGFILDGLQFLDDDIRETKIVAADGTPHIQGLVMGTNPHRGNQFGFTTEQGSALAATKILALIALDKAMRAAGSYMKAYLTDALNTIVQNCKADSDANPYWITTGHESEGMIENVTVRLVAI